MADGQITLLLQSDWSVFGRLADKTERELRRILRSSRDVPFRGDAGYDEEETSLRGGARRRPRPLVPDRAGHRGPASSNRRRCPRSTV